ncbi:MAG: DUF748 domain-containing protein [Bacteroidota bacterium]
MRKRKKAVIIIGVLVFALVGLRIYLPHWLTGYINTTLNEVEGYTGSISGVDISLIQGLYTIHDLRIEQETGDSPVPFIAADHLDFSIEWRALLNGRVVGEIDAYNPNLNFVLEDGAETENAQTGTEVDWTKPIKKLMPLTINRFGINDGKVSYRDFKSNPPIDIYIHQLQAEATNLSNVTNAQNPLPSELSAQGVSVGGGALAIKGRLNVLQQIPDMDYELTFEEADLSAFNDLARAYAFVDVERGNLSIYNELAVQNGEIQGYVKPVITDLKMIKLSEDIQQPVQMLWEGVAGVLTEIFENQPQDQFATKAPLSGNLEEVETQVWPTIFGIVKNAFFKAVTRKVEGSVDFNSLAAA